MEHKLIIVSLSDAQAYCSGCGWAMTCTGERTKEDIEKEYQKHADDVAATLQKVKANKAQYLTDGSFCPRCGSVDIEGHGLDVGSDGILKTASQGIHCNSCEFYWLDIYVLKGIMVDGEEV